MMEKKIALFFDAYAARFNRSLTDDEVDVNATVHAFAECFVEASPIGIICGTNDENFRESIPKGYDFYKKIGTKSMEIISRDIQLLDQFHAMVKIHWKSTYEKDDEKFIFIEFDVIYFVQMLEGVIKIFAYITGDEQKALQEHGLIPKE